MNIKKSLTLLSLTSLFILTSCASPKTEVSWAGEVHKVMALGDLTDNAFLSELTNGKHLYAVGPVSQLDGEITVLDGKCYVSRVDQQGQEKIEEDCSLKAPFLVYGYFSRWAPVKTNKAINNMAELRRNIMEVLIENGVITEEPSAFLIDAQMESVNYQVVTKYNGTYRSNQNMAVKKSLSGKKVTLIGFYSKHHGGIFTHGKEQLHIHMLSEDKMHSGHVTDFKLKSPAQFKMYVPTKM